MRTGLDSPDQVCRRDETLCVDFWYPRSDDAAKFIQIGLIDVRAADDIRVSYDFDRDGYLIEQPTATEEQFIEDGDWRWREVAFVPSWAPERR